MEALLFCFFDKVFSDLDRGCLMARYKRREMVEYFNTLIDGCRKGENCDPQSACRRAVEAAVNFHNVTRGNNSDLCLLGKYHNILYVAVKLCFDWRLDHNDTVCKLLNAIFECENTFERLIVGAIFGTRVTHLISGWKSDFTDREECLSAIEYFLDHAARGRLMFDVRGESKAMACVPMESYGRATPAKVCVQAGRPDALRLFIRYGAKTSDIEPQHCGLQLLLRHLQELAESFPTDPLPEPLLECLNVYVKILPRVPRIIEDPMLDEEPIVVHAAVLAAVPLDRSGYHPADLQHLSRCVVRRCLAHNGQLPYGTYGLGLPHSLQAYINFEEEISQNKIYF